MPVRALARVNLAAIERNVTRLRSSLTGGAELCAVVKADGYGHGAVQVARAALSAGASWTAVATAQEAAEVRAAGLEGRLLVMGALSVEELPVALRAGADLVAWTEDFVESVRRALPERGGGPPVGLHVKLDTGMGRLGARELESALAVVERVAEAGTAIVLRGVMTHFASADDDPEYVAEQLSRFRPFVDSVRARFPDIVVHAANSAGLLNAPDSHFGLVRCGIAIYGCDPMGADPAAVGLEPALELTSYVASLRELGRGDSVGYGRRFRAGGKVRAATVPIGYADGFVRALGNNCDLLIGGRRYPVVGAVSMDNLTVAAGLDSGMQVGDRVTVIGVDGGERQIAEDLARRIGTISYEVLCGISSRVPRSYHRDGVPA